MEIYRTRISVGLDVHARSVVACGLDRSTGEVFERRLTPDHEEILGWIRGLPDPAVVTYEAGPTGFGLARALAAAGIECRRRSTPRSSSTSLRWRIQRATGKERNMLYPSLFH